MQEPWYRPARKTWYVTVDRPDGGREQINLGRDKDQAWEEWHKILAANDRSEAQAPLFIELAEDYFAFAKLEIKRGELSVRTLKGYAWFLDRFIEKHGQIAVDELAPKHITNWLLRQENWGPTVQHNAITAVKRVLNWAESESRIKTNPIGKMKRPTPKVRNQMITRETHKRMILASGSQFGSGKIDRQFRCVLIALLHTGCRPQDICNVRVEHINQDATTWVIPDHKRKKHTGQPKMVYASPCVRTITRILRHNRTEGPLFRGRRGAVTVNAIDNRFQRLRDLLGLESGTVAYAYRHTFITEALTRDKPPTLATVAELVGTSITMIQKHYGHLDAKHDHLKNAAAAAMGYLDEQTSSTAS